MVSAKQTIWMKPFTPKSWQQILRATCFSSWNYIHQPLLHFHFPSLFTAPPQPTKPHLPQARQWWRKDPGNLEKTKPPEFFSAISPENSSWLTDRWSLLGVFFRPTSFFPPCFHLCYMGFASVWYGGLVVWYGVGGKFSNLNCFSRRSPDMENSFLMYNFTGISRDNWQIHPWKLTLENHHFQ